MTDHESEQMNRLQLDAVIENIGLERYTPAGVLALDLLLRHKSEQFEAGRKRQVELLIKAITFDQLASQIRNLEMSVCHKFFGFLTTQGRTKQLIFHITQFEPI